MKGKNGIMIKHIKVQIIFEESQNFYLVEN